MGCEGRPFSLATSCFLPANTSQDGTLHLIHIPLELYPLFMQPILKVLLPPSQGSSSETPLALDADHHRHRHGFLNISVTPVECSIVCNADWATSVFEPAIQQLPQDVAKMVAISEDTYGILHVITGGSDAGSRVAELTSPMAFANIPIFFVTTYYCDFILFPTKHRQAVVDALLAKGFGFSDEADQSRLVSPAPFRPEQTRAGPPKAATSPVAPTSTSRYTPGYEPWVAQLSTLSEPLVDVDTPPSPTPSFRAQDLLQSRTFALLKKRRVIPHVESDLVLVQCTGLRAISTRASAHGRTSSSSSANKATKLPPCWVDTIDMKLYTSVVAALASQPRFLSLTLAQEDPPSLLLDRDLLGLFGDAVIGPACITPCAGTTGGGERNGEGDEKDAGWLVPVFLDLADLPYEATGIVSGVAGGLVREMGGLEGVFGGLSYLSTARAGVVIFESGGAMQGMKVLLGLLMEDEAVEDDEKEEKEVDEPLLEPEMLEQLSLEETGRESGDRDQSGQAELAENGQEAREQAAQSGRHAAAI